MNRKKKTIPFEFILDALLPLVPVTRPMFGCTAVYVGPKIVLILRERESHPEDNGVWIATTAEHHASLRKEFPSMRSINVLGSGETNWQMLPSASDDFDRSAARACELILQHDPRIGKIPKAKKKKRK
ncbi:hypothetical protein HUU42_02770 [bacterium]|nr:hypothetical protein [bacterium]